MRSTRTLVKRPGLKVTYSRRSSDERCGRFGGGWQWKVGVQAGADPRNGTIVVSLLVAELTIDLRRRCPNPFCDGHGNLDVSPKMTGRSRTYGTCQVGPHR